MTTSAALAEPTSRPGSQPGPPADLHPGLVSEDALRALALSHQPFSNEIADGDWFSDNTTREQLVDIKEALINGEDLLLITGETGSGKTVLLKQLSGSGGSRIQCFSVRGSERFSTFNLFTGLLEAFKLKPPTELESTLKEVIPCLQALAERNMLGVIVLDDADLVSDKELRLLLGSLQYLNGGEDSLLRVLLAAKPEFESRIPGLLATTSELPYATLAMESFDVGRSAAYLEYRLTKAGNTGELPFSEAQLLAICQSADGLPSHLNTLAAAELNAFHLNANSEMPAASDGKDSNTPEYSANQGQLQEPSGVLPPAAPSLLNKQPVRMVLGLAAVGMLATAAWLFVNPNGFEGEKGSFAIVSKSPVRPISTDTNNPGLIALVEKPNSSSASGSTPVPENNAAASDITASATGQATAESTTENPATAQDSSAAETQSSDQGATTGNQASTQVIAPLSTAKPATTAQATTEATPADATAATSTDTPAPATAKPIATESATETTAAPEATAASTEPAPATTADKSTDSTLPLESANWVLVQNRELYTVQMSASDQRKDVEDFLKRSKLDAPNSIFSFKRGNNTWFALVHGLYPTITEARNAIESMPKSAKANQPWIRAISQIQDSVKSQ